MYAVSIFCLIPLISRQSKLRGQILPVVIESKKLAGSKLKQPLYILITRKKVLNFKYSNYFTYKIKHTSQCLGPSWHYCHRVNMYIYSVTIPVANRSRYLIIFFTSLYFTLPLYWCARTTRIACLFFISIFNIQTDTTFLSFYNNKDYVIQIVYANWTI